MEISPEFHLRSGYYNSFKEKEDDPLFAKITNFSITRFFTSKSLLEAGNKNGRNGK